MKLAEKLRTGKYKAPAPKVVEVETLQQRLKRKFEYCKNKFMEVLNKQKSANSQTGREFNILNFELNELEFEEIFHKEHTHPYKDFTVIEGTYFYKFLQWLKQEGFEIKGVSRNFEYGDVVSGSYYVYYLRVAW